ncbi:type I restriction enzyme S subunit [Geodermatophilus normandii]|uniref:Type I restriction enzyme S subunit n=1 Tax=Geodermatophilus normandii TaxID=1137989 RepID=A0A317QPZ2_9ACTN|nr:type I restriction enzyme S subunit [Geodermatophilus normandii]
MVSIGPSFGKTMVVPKELDGANLTQGTARVAVRPGLCTRYVVWALQSQTSVDFWESSIGGATFRALNLGPLAETPIPLPARDEQRAIADYLDRETARIDTLMDEQQRLIAMLRERRAAVISTALTPTDSWLRRRIKHIGETSLGKMLDAGRAVRPGDELRPYVRAADVRADGSVNLVDLNQMPFSEAEMEAFDLRSGDVLLIEGGATVGRPGFMFESAPGVAFQKTVNRLRVGHQADARFVYWSMLRLYELAYYANHYGSVSFVHLTGEKLREIELSLPSVDEQRVIAAHLDEQTAKIDALIAETERFIELARERRSALITAAVTGELDVREVA